VNEEDRVLYGYIMLSLDDAKRNIGKELALTNDRGKQQGFLRFENIEVVMKPSFVEYLKSGWFINLAVGIDFTASNKDHHKVEFGEKETHKNEYQTAILKVGSILEPYAHKKEVLAFGFGGIPEYQQMHEVSHCFCLNGSADSPTINGLDNLELFYKKAVNGTNMYGPTLFAPILRQMKSIIE
jgi:hypothetical protein